MRLIDADRLLSEPMKSKYYHLKNGDTAVPLIDIKNAPTVDAVPVRRGKWIYHRDEFDGDTAECSVCHVEGMLYGNYCPNCGAKMDEEGKDD